MTAREQIVAFARGAVLAAGVILILFGWPESIAVYGPGLLALASNVLRAETSEGIRWRPDAVTWLAVGLIAALALLLRRTP